MSRAHLGMKRPIRQFDKYYKMNENNGFILKPEMYSQEEWYKLFVKSIETINNLQSKIDKAYDYLDKFIPNEYGVLLTERQWNYVKKILKEDK